MSLKHGADPNRSGSPSINSLQTAIKHCSAKIVQALIDRGAALTDYEDSKDAYPIDADLPSSINSPSELSLSKDPTAPQNHSSKSESILEACAGREIGAADTLRILLLTGASLSISDPGRNPVLNTALEFFRGGNELSRCDRWDGRFKDSNSIKDILSSGPGAVVKNAATSSSIRKGR